MDVVVLLLPVPNILRLNMSTAKKYGLLATFLVSTPYRSSMQAQWHTDSVPDRLRSYSSELYPTLLPRQERLQDPEPKLGLLSHRTLASNRSLPFSHLLLHANDAWTPQSHVYACI